LLSVVASPTYATTLSHITIIWRTQPAPSMQSEVESSIESTCGSAFTETRLTRLLESILALCADFGHHRATLQPGNFNGSDDSLGFELAVDPGPVALISDWQLAGLHRTDSLWLVNALELPVNVAATREIIAGAVKRLSGFSSVSLDGSPEFVVHSDESVTVVLRLREQSPARFEGALAAASPNGADQALLGRFSLGLNGLFRRGHALDIQYEHPQPSERLLHVAYSEQYAFWRNLTSMLDFEDWRREDHRQRIGAGVSLKIWRRHNLNLLAGANWQKIAPLTSTTDPSRLYESTAGIRYGNEKTTGITVSGTYSLHRRWDRSTGVEASRARFRLESQGAAAVSLDSHSQIRVSYGSRWWGSGDQSRPGDEWFLGGDILSGYSSRSIAAYDGIWSRVEILRRSRSGLGIAMFGDQAWVRTFDEKYRRPATLGLALLLDSQGRSGRLELAWKDRASLRDGILRLSVIQDW
jgi:outer membrane protein assembly factor BamA